jgi:threonine synthase
VELVRVKTFPEAIKRMRQEVAEGGSYLASTGLNPYFIEGLKTVGFEIFEQTGVPDKVIVPTGSGGLITAIHKAFVELKDLGVSSTVPQMIAVQSSNVDPIVRAWREGTEIVPKEGKTIATAIMVKAPYNGFTAIRAINHSGGEGVTVTDDQIIEAAKELGREGIFAEPASAAALAALHKIEHRREEKIVLIITGSGLKDPMAVLK